MSVMRAVVISEFGDRDVLRVQEVEKPEPQRGEIRVRVRAAGVNRADLMQRRGFYPAPAGWPSDIPGLEYAGAVEALGREVGMWSVGDRVMGLVGGGGYAEFVVVEEREAITIPERLSFDEAAAIPEVFITAHDALFDQLHLRSGERLLIHAVGSGVGTAGLQLAKLAGATVFGTSRSAWKLERADELGLDLGVDTSTEDFGDVVRRETEGAGVHVVLDLVGGPYTAKSLECLAERGRLIVVGLAAGQKTELNLGLLLRNRLQIVGTALRGRPLEEKIVAARSFDRHVGPLLADGRVRPVLDKVFPFEEAAEAHRRMEENANFGKLVLDIAPR